MAVHLNKNKPGLLDFGFLKRRRTVGTDVHELVKLDFARDVKEVFFQNALNRSVAL